MTTKSAPKAKAQTPAAIQLPPQTQERLQQLILQRDSAAAHIQQILQTAKELLDVPDDWTIANINVGFMPPDNDAG